MRFANFLLGAAVALFIGGAAHAATVKVTFEGTVNSLRGFDSTPVALGQSVYSEFVLDDGQIGFDPDLSGGSKDVERFYQFTSGHVSFPDADIKVGFETSAFNSEAIWIAQISGSGGSSDYHIFAFNPSFASYRNQSISGFMSVAGFDLSATAFPTTDLSDLLASLPDVDTFDPKFYSIDLEGDSIFGTCADRCYIDMDLTKINVSQPAAVPVPAALPLMVLGLAGLGFAGRRRGRIA